MNFRFTNRYVNMGFESCALSWLSKILTEKKGLLSRSDFCKVTLSVIYFKKNLSSVLDTEYQDLLDAISRVSMMDTAVISFILYNVFKRYSRRNATSRFLRCYVSIMWGVYRVIQRVVYLDMGVVPKIALYHLTGAFW